MPPWAASAGVRQMPPKLGDKPCTAFYFRHDTTSNAGKEHLALNARYIGPEAWESFLGAIETSSPPIRALGITDYIGHDHRQRIGPHRLGDEAIMYRV